MPNRAPLDVTALRETWPRTDVIAETGSTNADLLARANNGEDIAGTALLAEHQTAGRGRHGRSWSAPPRSQLSISIGVDAGGVQTDTWGWLPLLTGVAVVETVREHYGIDAGLKWPNDVLVADGKLAGILAEVAPGQRVVIGIGLNVSLTVDELPDPRATSLTMLGAANPDRTELASNMLRALDSRIQQWRSGDPALAADYRSYSRTLGTPVRALLPGDAELQGTATDIDESGRLLIDDGVTTHTVAAGDITHLRS